MRVGLFLADEGEAVAEGDDDCFKLRVRGHVGVEAVEGEGLRVVVGDGVGHLAVPERIVGYDEASVAQTRQYEIQIFDIPTFVCVDIH